MGFRDDYLGSIHTPNSDFIGSIVANGKLIARLPPGPTYLFHQLRFTIAGVGATKAQIAAQIAQIRFLVDAVEKFNLTGLQWVDLMEFYRGSSVTLGVVNHFWYRPWMEVLVNQDGPAYGMKAADSFTCELTMAAAGITIDKIQMYHSTVDSEDLGEHLITVRQSYNFGGTGSQTITDIPKWPGMRLYALHITPPSGTTSVLSLVELLADNTRIIYGEPDTVHARYRLPTSPRVPQTNWRLHMDSVFRNRHIESFPLTMQDLRLNLTWATAAPAAFDLVLEYWQPAAQKSAA